ncbi:hypothetical protein TNCT_598431 [Trichonephila clavata]|uniref:Methyltransferase type 11 domain-containing protein n=1 Tax=Trichonephila clavata TaxID=2740835 RepID=A0A8X6JK73_TRICU|nr:hypothetical protein TNCT_598431 [Trichonephila clavata]
MAGMDTDPTLGRAVDFINKLKNEFNWQNLSGETIMDIGCGETFYCSQAIVHLFSDFKCLIVSDKSADLLRWRPPQSKLFENLQKNNIIKLLVADIENSVFFQDYIESVDKIVARNVLYQVNNKIQALRNIYTTLKPGGAAAILFWLDNPMGTWTNKILSTRKWSRYVDYSKPAPPSYFPSEFQEQSYRDEMQALGCREVYAVTRRKPCSYSSHEECQGQLLQIVDNIFSIPPERREECKEDCLRTFKQLVGCNNGGPITFNIIELFLHIVK